ncbi:type II secretion system GspH family protein [Candidatus Saccharibacteria bacterium]|nr:type II secretion system GspH family protein [Candidatus Saccharibacteria bacterium]
MHSWAKQKAFTIVELLIVIVVIAILAAITIVAYTGIQDRAKQAALQSAASQASKKILAYAVENTDLYPPDEATFFSSTNLADTPDTDYTYLTSPDRTHYCISATNPNNPTLSTAISDTSSGTVEGRCVRNMAVNPAVYNGNGNGWGFYAPQGGVVSAPTVGSGLPPSINWAYQVQLNATTSPSGPYFNLRITGPPVTVPVRISMYAKSSANLNVSLQTEKYNSSGVRGGTEVGSWPSLTAAWSRLSMPVSILSGYPNYVTTVYSNGTVVQGTTLALTGAMVTEGSALYSYGDGSTVGWSWDGTPNNSSSFGPAQLE